MNDDMLSFASEDAQGQEPERFWRILIVDDEESIHLVTRLALQNVTYLGRRLHFDSAYTAAEALEMLRGNHEYALAFVDVVMESDQAGLELVRRIREELGNRATRLILRTGQPGQSPEEDVIVQYDINDYKAKTELTSTKLFTTVIASLRSYEDIMALSRQRLGLERVVESMASVFTDSNLTLLVNGLLAQVEALLGLEPSSLFTYSFVGKGQLLESQIVSGTGEYESHTGERVIDVVEPAMLTQISRVVQEKQSYFGPDYSILYFGNEKTESFIVIKAPNLNRSKDRALLERTLRNLAFAFEQLNRIQHS